MPNCVVCTREYAAEEALSLYAEAGEWLAGEFWADGGRLCPSCLESRAKLAMMYCHDCNT
jgi:hypothetical protein